MINGVININKPEGITSAQTVLKIKEKLKLKKAGHAGTLDPFATGILIICLNRATKIAQYLSNSDKEYIGTMVLGITTDTQDLKGKVLKIKTVDPKSLKLAEIKKVFNRFQGDIWQKPPMFSAIKYKGMRLYNLARKGIQIDLALRKIKIHQLRILNIRYDCYPSIAFRVRCSKGTYIRTLCHDIGQLLGYGAYVSNLKRTGIGNHTITQSIDLDRFLQLSCKEHNEHILSTDEALSHFKKMILPESKKIVDKVKNGGQFSEQEVKKITPEGDIDLYEKLRVYSSDGHFLAIAKRLEKSSNTINIYKVEKVFS